MSITFLTAINDVLDRAGIIDANNALSSFTDTGIQTFIDLAKQLWNETVDTVATLTEDPLPGETASATITLSNGTREYTLPSDLVQIRWPLIDTTHGQWIWEYCPGGYEQMRIDQPEPSAWTGLPYYAAINPTTGLLRMDRAPDSNSDGFQYDMLYDKDMSMSATTDTIPFDAATYRAVMPVVTEGFQRRKRNDFDASEYSKQLARALLLATKKQRRTHW